METSPGKESATGKLERALGAVERSWDGLIRRFGSDRSHWQVGFESYLTHGQPHHLRIAGRVLREPNRFEAARGDSRWRNFRASIHRLRSDEVPNSRAVARFGSHSVEVSSDAEGYVSATIPLPRPLAPGWHPVEVMLDDLPYGETLAESFAAECLIPSPKARFGLISDVDDTILRTDVASRLRMLIWSLTHNAHTREPLPGSAGVYRMLTRVDGVEDTNPIFYVSSSPWNLYPMLEQFIELSEFPRGPLMLRDLGIGPDSSIRAEHGRKERNALDLIEEMPDLPFILLGDSGEDDAAIYSRIASRHPGRVLCAYIRDTGAGARAVIDEAIARTRASGAEMLLVQESAQIEEHARARGWIA